MSVASTGSCYVDTFIYITDDFRGVNTYRFKVMDFPQEKNDELEAFETVFRKNYNNFCNKVYTLVKDEDLAEDIVQNVFYKYWKNRKEIKIYSSVAAYIYKACIYESHTVLQATNKRNSINKDLFLNKSVSSNSVEDDYYYQETAQQIQKIIDALPPACKEVFLLSRYDEMTHQEIASYLNISINTVSNHIKKALKILRDFLLTVLLMPFFS